MEKLLLILIGIYYIWLFLEPSLFPSLSSQLSSNPISCILPLCGQHMLFKWETHSLVYVWIMPSTSRPLLNAERIVIDDIMAVIIKYCVQPCYMLFYSSISEENDLIYSQGGNIHLSKSTGVNIPSLFYFSLFCCWE